MPTSTRVARYDFADTGVIVDTLPLNEFAEGGVTIELEADLETATRGATGATAMAVNRNAGGVATLTMLATDRGVPLLLARLKIQRAEIGVALPMNFRLFNASLGDQINEPFARFLNVPGATQPGDGSVPTREFRLYLPNIREDMILGALNL